MGCNEDEATEPRHISGMRFAVAAAAIAATMVLAQGDAVADGGRLVLDGCQTSAVDPPAHGCSQLIGLDHPRAIAFSADGRSAYASYPDGLAAFDRDPVTGSLSFAECFDRGGVAPCTQIPGIVGTAVDIVVPRDGLSVYAAGGRRPTLIGFRRDSLTGRLTFASCEYSSYGAEGDLPGCPVGNFEEAHQIESSGDGRAIFLADRGCADNTGECFARVIAYDRDPQTSSLTPRDSVAPRFDSLGPFVFGGGALFTLEAGHGAISVFRRTGLATFAPAGCVTRTKARGCRTIRRMGQLSTLAISPNGRTLVAARVGRLAVFARGRTGQLRLRASKPLLRRARVGQLEFSPDGRSVYAVVTVAGGSGLLRFRANPRRGEIAYAQCLTEVRLRGCSHLPSLHGLSEVAGRGRFLYATTLAAPTPGIPDALLRFRALE
jgi:hypothetical protein